MILERNNCGDTTKMTKEIQWTNDFADALTRASRQNLPLLIDYADLPSCVGCVSLENNTYPNAEIIAYVNDNFVPVQFNQLENRELFEAREIVWTPTVAVCDSSGLERDRFIGYLPPAEYLPRLKLALARAAMFAGNWNEATAHLEDVSSNHENSLVAAESLYWLGVTRWKVSRDREDLNSAWKDLMETYPHSEAAVKASCL